MEQTSQTKKPSPKGHKSIIAQKAGSASLLAAKAMFFDLSQQI